VSLVGCASNSDESTYEREGSIPDPKTYTVDELFSLEEWRGPVR